MIIRIRFELAELLIALSCLMLVKGMLWWGITFFCAGLVSGLVRFGIEQEDKKKYYEMKEQNTQKLQSAIYGAYDACVLDDKKETTKH